MQWNRATGRVHFFMDVRGENRPQGHREASGTFTAVAIAAPLVNGSQRKRCQIVIVRDLLCLMRPACLDRCHGRALKHRIGDDGFFLPTDILHWTERRQKLNQCSKTEAAFANDDLESELE